ncbi:MAG: hypothetical protein ABI614_05620 [Planctomycetota bacterium]
MLASLFQFSFLSVVALANLCLGFAIASWLGWGPPLSMLFEIDKTTAFDSSHTSEDSGAEEDSRAAAHVG